MITVTYDSPVITPCLRPKRLLLFLLHSLSWARHDAHAGPGYRPRPPYRAAQFSFVISVLTQSDLVAILPERLVRNHPVLQQLKPPLAVPGFEMTMLWHERSHRDPAHQWLREHIVRLV
nr:LysR substrate-binding domain-containing protein [Serratia marcescens]